MWRRTTAGILALSLTLLLAACGVSSDPEGCGGGFAGGSCAPQPMEHGGTGKHINDEVRALREDLNLIIKPVITRLEKTKVTLREYNLGGSTKDVFSDVSSTNRTRYTQRYLNGDRGISIHEMYVGRAGGHPGTAAAQNDQWQVNALATLVRARLDALEKKGTIIAYTEHTPSSVSSRYVFEFTSVSAYQRQEAMQLKQHGTITLVDDGYAAKDDAPGEYDHLIIKLNPGQADKLFPLDALPLTTQNVLNNWWNNSERKPARAIQTD